MSKKFLLSLGALVAFAGCQAGTKIKIDSESELSVKNQFLKHTHSILNAPFARTEFSFKVDGKQGREECWVMTKEEFVAYNDLIEYAAVGYSVIVDENNEEVSYISFTGKVGLEQNVHFCGLKKASFVDKGFMFLKSKDYKVFLKDAWIRVTDDSYTHVAVKTDLKVNPFAIVNVTSRIYPNVPMVSQIGNLPGLFPRVDGKTAKKGNLVGFSYRSTKGDNSAANNAKQPTYIFGQLYKEEAN